MQNLIVRVTEFQNLHDPIPEGQAISIDYELVFNCRNKDWSVHFHLISCYISLYF